MIVDTRLAPGDLVLALRDELVEAQRSASAADGGIVAASRGTLGETARMTLRREAHRSCGDILAELELLGLPD